MTRRRTPHVGPSQGDIRRQIAFLAGDTAAPIPKPRKPKGFRLEAPTPDEGAIVDAVLGYLEIHPLVAIAWKMNNGAAEDSRGNFFRFVRTRSNQPVEGWPDVGGVLHSGGWLGIECKRTAKDWRTVEWFEANRDAAELDVGEAAWRILSQWRFLRALQAKPEARAGVVYGPSWQARVDLVLANEGPGL